MLRALVAQPVVGKLGLELHAAAGAVQVAVYPGSGRRGHELLFFGVDVAKLREQPAIVSQVVLLVVVLGDPERAEPLDPRGYRSPDDRREALGALGGQLELLIVMHKHERCILRLPSRSRRVMRCPEQLEQVVVGDLGRVEVDLEALGVVTHRAVGGLLLGATRVSYARSPDSLHEPEPGVRGPESTDGEGRGLEVPGHPQIDRRAMLLDGRRVAPERESHGAHLLGKRLPKAD